MQLSFFFLFLGEIHKHKTLEEQDQTAWQIWAVLPQGMSLL